MLFRMTATLASSRQCRLAFDKTTRAQFKIVETAQRRPAIPQKGFRHLYSTKSTTHRLSESAKDSLRQTWGRFGLDPAKSYNREEVKDAWKEHLSKSFGASKYHDTAHSREIAQINAQFEQVLASFYSEPGSTVSLAEFTSPQPVQESETSKSKRRKSVCRMQASKKKLPRSNRQQRPHDTMERNEVRDTEKPSSTLRHAPVEPERSVKASLLNSEAPLQPMRRFERPQPQAAPTRGRWNIWMPDDIRAYRLQDLARTRSALSHLSWIRHPVAKARVLLVQCHLQILPALYPLFRTLVFLWNFVSILIAALSNVVSLLSRRQ